MEFLTNTKFPFLKYRKTLMILSVVAIALSFALLFTKNLNFGIDFKGGTQIVVKLRNGANTDTVRNALAAGGVPDAQIQQYGKPEAQEFLIRAPLAEKLATQEVGASREEGRSKEIIAALDLAFNGGDAKTDLNQRGSLQIQQMLIASDPDGKNASSGADEAANHYRTVADSIVAERKKAGIFGDWSQIGAAPGVSPAVLSYLQGTSTLGNFQIVSNESVGAAIGQELRTKGVLAVVFALIAMLVYIWIQFEKLHFGIGALMASFHDVVVTLGLFILFDYEFGLTTIAAFLTLVGYSINDTVVIFDRVRENLRRHRRLGLEAVMDLSINETLPRTIMTSGTMLVSCAALFFFGGEVLRGFSFVMLVGVIIGTYSSVFIASPFALWWDSIQNKKSEITKAAQV